MIVAAAFLAGALFAAVGALGAVYLMTDIAAILMLRPPAGGAAPNPTTPVSVLVPLCGAEPGLYERLEALVRQDYAAAVQLVCAAADSADPALAVARALRERHPDRRIVIVADPLSQGPNRKISNLINAMQAAAHDAVVMLDSDILVDRGYLRRVIAALEQPGVGAATNLYHGVSGDRVWSALSALSINAQFVPSVIFALRFRMADPCFGATIAISRAFLESLGGLAAFADRLQDDYAIGMAVRAAGREVAIITETVGHVCAESSAGGFFDTQLRVAHTTRAITPSGYAGSVITQPFAPAMLAAILLHNAAGVALLALVAALRVAQTHAVRRVFALPPQPYHLLPLRDLLAFAAYVAAFFTRDVVWRGEHYRLSAGGGLTRWEATAERRRAHVLERSS
jgi:ceramide glucosyltransferase